MTREERDIAALPTKYQHRMAELVLAGWKFTYNPKGIGMQADGTPPWSRDYWLASHPRKEYPTCAVPANVIRTRLIDAIMDVNRLEWDDANGYKRVLP